MGPDQSRWRRLHPVTIVMDVWPILKQLGWPFLLLLYSALTREGGPSDITQLFLGLGVLIAVPSIMARYLTFRYRLGEGEIELKWGILRRHERRIPYGRIQNIDVRRNAVARVTGTAELHLETGAGDDSPEGQLRMLSHAEALDLQQVLAGRVGEVRDAGVPGGAEPVYGLEGRELVLAGLLHGRGMIVVAAIIGLALEANVFGSIEDRLPEDSAITSVLDRDWPWHLVVIGTALSLTGIMLLLRLLSSIWMVVKWYGFRLAREGDSLRVSYGLISRRERSMPIRRIQSVTVRSTLLQRRAGRVSIGVATAGDSLKSSREWLAPLVRDAEVPRLLAVVMPGLDPAQLRWREVDRSIRWRRPLGWLLVAVPLAVPAGMLIHPWLAPALPVAAAVYGAIRGLLDERRLGWAGGGGMTAFRSGGLTRVTTMVPITRVQTVIEDRSPFDRLAGTASVTVDSAGSGWHAISRMPYLPEDAAREFGEGVAAAAAATEFRW